MVVGRTVGVIIVVGAACCTVFSPFPACSSEVEAASVADADADANVADVADVAEDADVADVASVADVADAEAKADAVAALLAATVSCIRTILRWLSGCPCSA